MEIEVPQGEVLQIARRDGVVLWEENPEKYRYVSLGDSIAAGHAIDPAWLDSYGEGSQYGKNGNTETALVPDCYTDRIRAELYDEWGRKTQTTSFARSGDTVADLMSKLNQNAVKVAVGAANLVTVCIGANDVLAPAFGSLADYLNGGDSSAITERVNANLAALADDSSANGYTALLRRLHELNPNATVAFTTIYNPYKYLWLEEGRNGFIKPVLDAIPDLAINGISVTDALKESLVKYSGYSDMVERINAIGALAEQYVTDLNSVITGKVAAFQATNPKFITTETKALFDGVPDRSITATYHYNDLVNVSFTRGLDVYEVNWQLLFDGTGDGNAYAYWWNKIRKHGIDYAAIAAEFVAETIEYVITPNADPHPKKAGHYYLYRAFADALGWESLDRYEVSYAANGGSGTMDTQTILTLDGLMAYAAIRGCSYTASQEGYRFVRWVDVNDTSREFHPGDWIGFSGGLPLQAVWSNLYTLVYRVTNSTGGLYTDGDNSGPQSAYALRIGGTDKDIEPKFSNFNQDAKIYTLEYGTQIEVLATCKTSTSDGFPGSHNGRIYLNGTNIADSKPAYYMWALTGDTDVRFDWVINGTLYLTAAQWWDCYITTA